MRRRSATWTRIEPIASLLFSGLKFDRGSGRRLVREGRRIVGTPTGVLAYATIATIIIRMLNSVVLTRLLAPNVFGLVGIINSIYFTVGMLTDLGFQSYVIRHPDGDDPRFIDVIWTIHAWRGTLLALIGVATAPLFAVLLHKPELTWPLAASALTLLFSGWTSLSLVSTLRRGGAKRLTLLELYVLIFQTILCIVLALWLRSVWAIIIGMIAAAALRLVASYTSFGAVRHRFARDRALSRDFFKFSRVVLASSTLMLVLSQTDKFVLARLFTLGEFGLYAIAINLVSAPQAFVGGYVQRVLYPIYAKTWHEAPGELRAVYRQSRRKVALLYMFAGGGLIGGAPLLVAILYDPRYLAAAPFLSLLAISSTLKLTTLAAAELMTATGEVRVTLRANIVRLAWLAAAGPTGFYCFGAVGLVCAVGMIEVPAMIYQWFVLKRIGVLDLRDELTQVAVMIAGFVASYALGTLALYLMPQL